jgi:hypothetical protein
MAFASILQRLSRPFEALEVVLSRKVNMLIFLVVRFLVMSAMVVGFSWVSLGLHP